MNMAALFNDSVFTPRYSVTVAEPPESCNLQASIVGAFTGD